MRSDRPTGVSLIAILSFLGGALVILMSLCTLFTPIPGQASIVPLLLGLLWLALGAFYIAIGWGLWELRDWARIAAIVVHGLNVVGGLAFGAILLFGVSIRALDPYLGIIGGTVSFPGMGIAFWIVAAISGVIIWYLLTPDVQYAFVAGPGPGPEPPRHQAPLLTTQPVVRTPSSSAPARGRVEKTALWDQAEPVQGWLVVRSGPRTGKMVALGASARSTIGRDGEHCDLVLEDRYVSAEHARVQYERGQFVLYDLASANGTFLNKRRIQRQGLMDGDEIRVGGTTLVFKSV